MSLFTDGPFITLSDLLAIEGEVSIVADAQGITVADVIKTATLEVGNWLLAQMQRFNAGGQDAVLNWHISAYAAGFTESSNRPRISLSQVVVTDAEFPLMKTDFGNVCLYEAARQFYRNASRMADTDRYEEKRDYYSKELRNVYRPRLLRAGIPVVGRPMPCPAAQWEPGSGLFTSADVTTTTGGSIASGTYDIALTYEDSGQSTNSESGLSARVSKAITLGQIPVVSIARLNPPTGTTRAAQQPRVLVQQLNATHYNVYAGAVGGTLYKQNTSAIPIGTTSWTLPATLLTETEAGVGQWADRYLTISPPLFRG